MIKLQRLGHVLIAVRDLEKSKDFYTRILGFHILEEDPEHGGVFLSIGGLGNTLDLFPCKDPDALARPTASGLSRAAARAWSGVQSPLATRAERRAGGMLCESECRLAVTSPQRASRPSRVSSGSVATRSL